MTLQYGREPLLAGPEYRVYSYGDEDVTSRDRTTWSPDLNTVKKRLTRTLEEWSDAAHAANAADAYDEEPEELTPAFVASLMPMLDFEREHSTASSSNDSLHYIAKQVRPDRPRSRLSVAQARNDALTRRIVELNQRLRELEEREARLKTSLREAKRRERHALRARDVLLARSSSRGMATPMRTYDTPPLPRKKAVDLSRAPRRHDRSSFAEIPATPRTPDSELKRQAESQMKAMQEVRSLNDALLRCLNELRDRHERALGPSKDNPSSPRKDKHRRLSSRTSLGKRPLSTVPEVPSVPDIYTSAPDGRPQASMKPGYSFDSSTAAASNKPETNRGATGKLDGLPEQSDHSSPLADVIAFYERSQHRISASTGVTTGHTGPSDTYTNFESPMPSSKSKPSTRDSYSFGYQEPAGPSQPTYPLDVPRGRPRQRQAKHRRSRDMQSPVHTSSSDDEALLGNPTRTVRGNARLDSQKSVSSSPQTDRRSSSPTIGSVGSTTERQASQQTIRGVQQSEWKYMDPSVSSVAEQLRRNRNTAGTFASSTGISGEDRRTMSDRQSYSTRYSTMDSDELMDSFYTAAGEARTGPSSPSGSESGSAEYEQPRRNVEDLQELFPRPVTEQEQERLNSLHSSTQSRSGTPSEEARRKGKIRAAADYDYKRQADAALAQSFLTSRRGKDPSASSLGRKVQRPQITDAGDMRFSWGEDRGTDGPFGLGMGNVRRGRR
ncbi:hypothetical protein FH972_023697 [Carpinus fangiana]|uniref:Uncharacterized protein n=1 Tax=Carpinus fangiana TaxID=176857 RepID=A0A5N6KVY7_9ROSI|nr:hypothetical protein FH972_023697 [Carpinus fangiana]